MEHIGHLVPGTPAYQLIFSSLDEWRQQVLPERDSLFGETSGDNLSHLIVRGTFLDLVFSSQPVDEFLNRLTGSTRIETNLLPLSTVNPGHNSPETLHASKLKAMEEYPSQTPFNGEFEYQEIENDSLLLTFTSLCNEFTDHIQNPETMEEISASIWNFLQYINCPYQWLFMEFLGV